MPVTEHSKINSADYNAIRNKIDAVMGTGASSSGYGQMLKSASKSINQKISQTDWDLLRYDIVNARLHQRGSVFSASTNTSNAADRTKLQFLTSNVGFLVVGMAVFGVDPHPITAIKFITAIQTSGVNTIVTLNAATEASVPSGTLIQFGTGSVSDFNVDNKISVTPINSYESLADTANLVTERFLVAPGRFTTTAADSISRVWSGSTTPRFWSNEISTTLTVTFSNANEARWFFNSGGEIRIASSRTNGRSDQQNNDWSSLLSSIGVRSFGSQQPSSGFFPMDGLNFYRLTNTYQIYFSQASSSPYADNIYQIQARCNVADNSAGTATSVFIRVRFIGGYIDPGDNPLDIPRTNDEIDGNFTVTAIQKYASGTVLPSGNFTVILPTYSFSEISGT